MSPSTLSEIIRDRAKAKDARERAQLQLVNENDHFHHSIREKLKPLWQSKQFDNFTKCGMPVIVRCCTGCRTVEKLGWRCNIKWCPRCQWRLAEARKAIVTEYASRITQPKHVVLTQRNFPVLTRRKIREHQRALAALRRRTSFAQVKGGCCSVEVTNESRGWHLHSHWLVDARWIDHKALAEDWADLVGQEFAIVRVYDARDRSYVQELCKYVVEGSEAARWKPDELNEFVRAVRGCRFFFSFGALAKLAPEIRRYLEAQKEPAAVCQCGCSRFSFRDASHRPMDMATLNRSFKQNLKWAKRLLTPTHK